MFAARMSHSALTVLLFLSFVASVPAQHKVQLQQPLNTWIKRSPLPEAPPSPMLGYEGSYGYDSTNKRLIRWAGHNQGGGGEQNAETWAYHPVSARWALMEPNRSPPGVCCAQQNVFDPCGGRFLRFQSFSGSHGWQWFREIYLNNSSVWSYDLAANTWRDMRAYPAPRTAPLRCASWDSDAQVVVIFGGEGSHEGTVVYDPHVNTWTRMKPASEPEGRSGGNMAYDPIAKRHILFGSQFDDEQHTWAYDLRANAWTDLKPEALPPTKTCDAVLAYDAASRKIVCVVQAIDEKAGDGAVAGHLETWLYDSAANRWTRANPAQEPQGWGNRRRIMAAIPEQNVILMESYINPTTRVPGVDREQQVWTYRAADTPAAASFESPVGVQLTTSADRVKVEWQKQASTKGYAVFRGAAEQPWLVDYQQVAKLAADAGEWTDRDVVRGQSRHYYVVALDAADRPSAPSKKVRTQPAIAEDVIAGPISENEIRLTWKAPAGDVVGYHVERAVVEPFSEAQIKRLATDTPPLAEPNVGGIKAIGPFVRVSTELLPRPSFVDYGVNLRTPAKIEGEPVMRHYFRDDQLVADAPGYRYAMYAYRVRAVNALGVESGPSALAYSIPSAPQFVFAKEEGDTGCRLKWAANPESGIVGYHVYRMGSPRINGAGQKTLRLTDSPHKTLEYFDRDASPETSRYWVTAVDLLGQEGIPSAPAWSRRQYRKIYEQFTGPWHQ